MNESAVSLNQTSHGIPFHPGLSRLQEYVIAIYLIVTGLLSLAGNGLILLAFCRFQTLKTTTNILLANLAMTDFGICVFTFPLSITSHLHDGWVFGEDLCRWYGFNGVFFGLSSIGFLTAISCDRYLVTCKHDLYVKLKKGHFFILSILVWSFALIWSVAPFMGWSCYSLDVTKLLCTVTSRCHGNGLYVSYVYSVAIIFFFIPCGIIIYCYQKTYHFINKLGNGGVHENIEWTHQKQVTKMCAIAVILFLVAWLPLTLHFLLMSFMDPTTVPAIIHVTPPIFAKSSAFYNPLIYAVVNRRFRIAIRKTFSCDGNIRDLEAVPMNRIHLG